MEFHRKRFGQTESIVLEVQAQCIIIFLMFDVEGRSLMTQPPGGFNKAASKAYRQLTREERTVLEEEAAEGKHVTLNKRDIMMA